MFGSIESNHIPPNYRFHSQANMRFRNTNSSNYRGQQNFDSTNFNYWCETCDKGFRTPGHLEIHKQQHQKCNIDGCEFIAHPKVVTKHIQMQHSTGLYKKIANINNPEEIRKWREERKKKYPTKENIEKKTAEIKEKIARGEKMGINGNKYQKNFKDKLKFKHSDDRNFKSKFPFKHENFNRRKRNLPNEKLDNISNSKKIYKSIITIEEEPRKLKPFGGIQDLIIDDDKDDSKQSETDNVKDLIEDDEFVEDISVIHDNVMDISKSNVCGALTALMCDYGSSDEEVVTKDIPKNNKDYLQNKLTISINNAESQSSEINNQFAPENKDNKLPITQNVPNGNTTPNPTVNTNIDQNDDDSGPEETKVIKARGFEETKRDSCPKEKMLRNKKNKFIIKHKQPLKQKLPSTLLEKLLHREIEQERNIVLQCIRYVVQNNYFEQNK